MSWYLLLKQPKISPQRLKSTAQKSPEKVVEESPERTAESSAHHEAIGQTGDHLSNLAILTLYFFFTFWILTSFLSDERVGESTENSPPPQVLTLSIPVNLPESHDDVPADNTGDQPLPQDAIHSPPRVRIFSDSAHYRPFGKTSSSTLTWNRIVSRRLASLRYMMNTLGRKVKNPLPSSNCPLKIKPDWMEFFPCSTRTSLLWCKKQIKLGTLLTLLIKIFLQTSRLPLTQLLTSTITLVQWREQATTLPSRILWRRRLYCQRKRLKTCTPKSNLAVKP